MIPMGLHSDTMLQKSIRTTDTTLPQYIYSVETIVREILRKILGLKKAAETEFIFYNENDPRTVSNVRENLELGQKKEDALEKIETGRIANELFTFQENRRH